MAVTAAVGTSAVLAGGAVVWGLAAALPLTLALVMAGLLLGARRPAAAVAALVVYLGLMGLVRRLSDYYIASSSLNPLYLIGPALIVFWAFRDRDVIRARAGRLSIAVFWFQIALVVSALNPLQGSPIVGFGGLALITAPTLLFWLGVRHADGPAAVAVFRAVLAVSIVSAGYGLLQDIGGFPVWDQNWVDKSGIASLYLADGVVRSFGANAAASDYTGLLSIGAVVAVAAACSRDRRRIIWRLACTAFALLAVVLIVSSGSRGPLLLALVASTLVICARLRLSWVTLPILFFAVGSSAVVSLLTAAASIQGLGEGSSAGYERQLEGFDDPTGDTSTLPGHIERLVNGLRLAATNPIGHGIGSTTSFARFGSSYGSEVDVSNVAAGLGIIGLLLYLALVVLTFRAAWHSARRDRDWVALASLGVLAVTFNSWLNGGNYVVIAIVWLTVGMVARRQTDAAARESSARPPGVSRHLEPSVQA